MQCLKALGYISFWLQLPETVLIFLQVRRENSEKWFKVPHSPLLNTTRPTTDPPSFVKPRSHIHVRGYGPRGLITDGEVTDETWCSTPVVAGNHVPTVRVRKRRAVGGFDTVSWRQDQGNSGLYHGPPWRHR